MNKYAVLKFGGHALKENDSLKTLIDNIKYLKNNNYKVVIVHGGTPSVNEKLKKEKIESQFVDGYRVTTKEIMHIVEEAILGNEISEIVKTLNKHELSSVGLSGIDSNLIKCKKAKLSKTVDYGFVGEIVNINNNLIYALCENDFIPVISPIGCDDLGNSYNMNSDYLASKVAINIRADYLFMITNVNGIYMDIKKPNTRIKLIDEDMANNLIKDGVILPTMKTKVDACLDYANKSNNPVYIIDSKQKINYELFNTSKYGTKIVSRIKDYSIRLAHQNDIKQIIKIMKQAFPKYQEHIDYKINPLTETYEDILKEIDKKWIFVLEKGNKVIGMIRINIIDHEWARFSRICGLNEYQNCGFGSILVKFAEDYARYKGINKIGLTTLDNIKYLEKFYEKNGYVKIATDDRRGYTRSLMAKDLNSNFDNININLFF